MQLFGNPLSLLIKHETTRNHPNPPEATRNHPKPPEPTQKSPESNLDIMYTDPKNDPSTQTGIITVINVGRASLV